MLLFKKKSAFLLLSVKPKPDSQIKIFLIRADYETEIKGIPNQSISWVPRSSNLFEIISLDIIKILFCFILILSLHKICENMGH